MANPRLDDDQVADRLAELPGWEHEDERIVATFTFADFSEAFGFMARAALAAEKLDHHPDWSNSWNRVDVSITNHEAGGLSEDCFALARAMSDLVA